MPKSCNFAKIPGLRAWDDGGHDSIIDSHGDADIHFQIEADPLACPACIQARMLYQDSSCESDQEVRLCGSHRRTSWSLSQLEDALPGLELRERPGGPSV